MTKILMLHAKGNKALILILRGKMNARTVVGRGVRKVC